MAQVSNLGHQSALVLSKNAFKSFVFNIVYLRLAGRILLLYKRGGWVKSQHLVPSYQAFWEKTKNKKRGGGEQESLYGLLHRIAQKKVRAKFKIKKDSLNWEVVKAWDKTTWNCSFHPFRAQDQRLKRSTGAIAFKVCPMLTWPPATCISLEIKARRGGRVDTRVQFLASPGTLVLQPWASQFLLGLTDTF